MSFVGQVPKEMQKAEAMASCEKCWSDACGDPCDYANLVHLRSRNGETCTPEEQAGGMHADLCEKCGRRTVHVHCKVCMVVGCGPMED